MGDHTCVGVTPFFSCELLNSHGLDCVLGSALRGARDQNKTHERWNVHLKCIKLLSAQSVCALVCRISWCRTSDLTGEIQNTLYSSFFYVAIVYVTFYACCF